MELKEVASISGKGGLFKIIKPGKAGVLLESLDEAKTKLVKNLYIHFPSYETFFSIIRNHIFINRFY